MPYILSDFEMIRPSHELQQEKILEWVAKAHAQAESSLQGWAEGSLEYSLFLEKILSKIRALGLGEQKILKRGFEIADLFEENWKEMSIYPVAQKPRGAFLQDRLAFFHKKVCEALQRFYPEGKALPAHLIHATCTGYVAPSAAQVLVSQRKAGKDTNVTHAYHMGCYASFPALRMARNFFRSDKKKVDIVHTELCSLHMNALLHQTEQLVVQTLFADGYIKYTFSSKGRGLKIKGLKEEILPNSLSSMGWECEEWGFKMVLSKEVPVYIVRALPSFLEGLLGKKKGIIKKALFALHPGGTKILQQIANALNLEAHQVQHSLDVFQQYGNMSSATLPHIWQRIVADPAVGQGTPIISLAYGPGLTICGGFFEKI